MGLINNDSFTASNGVEKAGTYISFNNETIYLRKSSAMYQMGSSTPSADSKIYMINANYRIFWDKAAKDAGKSFIELRNVSAGISEEQLSGNLYSHLYEELKKQYPNSEDELLTKVTETPVVSSDSTVAPATSSDSTAAPATSSDSTAAPATSSDSTVAPATSSDSTVAPATSSDSTVAPATSSDSTAAPATSSDSTVAPATSSDSTVAPATSSNSTVTPQ